MSSGRRRPGVHGAATLLLLGIVFLGVGVLLYLSGDDRTLVARDLGDVPGSASTAAVLRPLAEDIPVLSGLDELPAPSAGPVPGVDGGFDVPAAAPSAAVQSAVASVEPTPALADPTFTPIAPRPLPRPLPTPEQPIAPQEPGLVSPLYALPPPTPAPVPRAPLVPARLELPARAVTAPVDAVGTGPGGGMVVPEEVRTVGWWAPGVAPGGAVGSAVIAGHVDSRTAGLGVLSVLPQLTEGEPLLIADVTGRTVAYRVVARREYRKYDLPRDVFRRDGAPQLVLITCGGVFDPAARSYESNIVVYAVPA